MNTEQTIINRLDVRMWCRGDLSFLYDTNDRTIRTQIKKDLEDEWGRNILRIYRPDLILNGQWTACFGELIVKQLLGARSAQAIEYVNTRTSGVRHHKLDLETDDYMIEVKTQTYNTSGTAHEKIYGVPWKYATIPRKTGKQLLIVCVGCAENLGYRVGLFGSDDQDQNDYLEFYKNKGIVFVPFTKLLDNEIRLT